MKILVSLISAVGAVSLLPTIANAQQAWLPDRQKTEGGGLTAGNFEFHPGLGGEFGYDSNYFHRASDEDPIGALRFKVTPSFAVSTLRSRGSAAGGTPPEVEFRTGISGTYNEFLGVSGSQSGKDAMSDQRNVTFNADLNLAILPGRTWSGTIYGGAARNVTPTATGDIDNSFNRYSTQAGAELAWAPGGGLLDWRLGYRFQGTFFENTGFDMFKSFEHTAQTRGRWRFLPRTSITYDARLGFVDFPNNDVKQGAHPLRTLLGLNGLITPSMSILLNAGWGASFYEPEGQEDFDSVIGQAEVKWYINVSGPVEAGGPPPALSTVALGFVRDFDDSYLGTYSERNRGYINGSHMFGGVFLLNVDAGLNYVRYPEQFVLTTDAPTVPGAAIQEPFHTLRVDAGLSGEYRLADSLGLNVTGRYASNLIKDDVFVGIDATSNEKVANNLSWNQIEAYVGLRWFM